MSEYFRWHDNDEMERAFPLFAFFQLLDTETVKSEQSNKRNIWIKNGLILRGTLSKTVSPWTRLSLPCASSTWTVLLQKQHRRKLNWTSTKQMSLLKTALFPLAKELRCLGRNGVGRSPSLNLNRNVAARCGQKRS